MTREMGGKSNVLKWYLILKAEEQARQLDLLIFRTGETAETQQLRENIDGLKAHIKSQYGSESLPEYMRRKGWA